MEGDATVIRMDICSFSPTIARVPVGTTVRFLNTSTDEHAVIERASTWAQRHPAGRQGLLRDVRRRLVSYPVLVPARHPGMVGAIVVGGRCTRGRLGGSDRAIGVWARPDIAQALRRRACDPRGPTGRRCALAAVVGLGAGVILAGLIGAVVETHGWGPRHAHERLTGAGRRPSTGLGLGYTPAASIQSAYSLCSLAVASRP